MMDLMDNFPPMLYIQMRVSCVSVKEIEAYFSDHNMTPLLGGSERPILMFRLIRLWQWTDSWWM